MLSVLGLPHSVSTRRGSRARNLVVRSRAAGAWLLEHFGQYSAGKTLPVWLLGADDRYRKAFLDAYLAGDGHWASSKRRWELSTSSLQLAVGLRLLGQSLGFQGTLSWYQPSTTHILEVQLRDAPQRAHRVHLTDHGHGIVDDCAVWSKASKVEDIGLQVVYGLLIESDGSFVADGLIHHQP